MGCLSFTNSTLEKLQRRGKYNYLARSCYIKLWRLTANLSIERGDDFLHDSASLGQKPFYSA